MLTVAVPFRVNFDPPAVVKTGVTVASVTSGRLKRALKVFVASVWRSSFVLVAASFDSINAVESRATWNAVRAAFTRE